MTEPTQPGPQVEPTELDQKTPQQPVPQPAQDIPPAKRPPGVLNDGRTLKAVHAERVDAMVAALNTKEAHER